jgi:acetyltransferase-like isoleucine patch superfamily enzyme
MIKYWHKELSNIGNCLIGEGSIIHSHVWIGDRVKIGERCRIQAFAFIPTGVRLGNDVFIGPHVCFTNDKYPPSNEWEVTIVEDYVSIGAGAVILPGVTLGTGCKIGAGAVVTKNVPAGETWVGNPAALHRPKET